MKRIIPYFNVYAADFKAFKDKITPEEWWEICDAMCDLCMFGETKTQQLEKFSQILFEKITQDFKRNSKSYNASVENGRKGGRPRDPVSKPIGSNQVNLNETCSQTIQDKTRQYKIRKENTKRKKFSAPTIEEIKEYCRERKNSVAPEKFLNHYESNGWMVGKNKMKDWKAAIRTWEGNDINKQPKEEDRWKGIL